MVDQMQKCEDCQSIFEDDEVLVRDEPQVHEYWGGFFRENLYGAYCPRCGSDRLEEFTEEEEED